MKFSFYSILLFLFQLSFAQNFTKAEKDLILQSPNEIMRVMQMKNKSDSIIMKSLSDKLNPKDQLTKLLAKRMLKSVQDPLNPGVGIAAPQVGINRRMILVQRFDKENHPFDIFVNPEIKWKSNLMQLGPEGDLSFEQRGQVYRYYLIQIVYENLEGEVKDEILEGFTSVIFQHERDHLDGILLTDRIDEQKERSYTPSNQHINLFFEKVN